MRLSASAASGPNACMSQRAVVVSMMLAIIATAAHAKAKGTARGYSTFYRKKRSVTSPVFTGAGPKTRQTLF